MSFSFLKMGTWLLQKKWSPMSRKKQRINIAIGGRKAGNGDED